MANEIISTITLDLDEYRKQLLKAEKEGSESGEKAGKGLGDGMEKGFSVGWGKVIALVGTIVSVFSLKKMVEEATAGEDSVNRLAFAMHAAGIGGAESASKFDDWAHKMQSVVGVADDVITSNAAMLASLGHLSGEGLQRASAAAIDFAKGMNVDVSSAFTMMSKAAAGNVELFKRYGIEVAKTGDEAKDFAVVLGKIEAMFGGMAAGSMNTFSGQMKRVSLGFNDVFEAMGNLIIKSPVVVSLMKFLGDAFNQIALAITKFGKGDGLGDLIKQLLEVSRILTVYIGAPLELLYNTGKMVFYGLSTIVSAFVTSTIVTLEWLAKAGALLSDKFVGIRDSLTAMKDASIATTAELAEKAKAGWEEIFNFDATAATENFVVGLQQVVDNAAPVGQNIADNLVAPIFATMPSAWEFITNGFNSAFSRVALTSEKFRTELQGKLNNAFTAFRDGVSTSFAVIGAAMVKGENVFGAFGKALLGLFGDLAIQLGSFYFTLGLASWWTNPVSGTGMMVGGAALVVLGGALKALAGGGGSAAGGSTGSSTGGGVSAEGGGGLAQSMGNSSGSLAEEKEKGTQVQVVVQGNVLDRKETGLAIAEIIQEQFASNGVVFATGNANA